MLYVFSTNRVKLVARKPKTTNNMGQREYVSFLYFLSLAFVRVCIFCKCQRSLFVFLVTTICYLALYSNEIAEVQYYYCYFFKKNYINSGTTAQNGVQYSSEEPMVLNCQV